MAGYRPNYYSHLNKKVNRGDEDNASNSDVDSDNQGSDGDYVMETESTGLIEYNQTPDLEAPKAVKRCDLIIACPVSGCKGDKISWKCTKCDAFVEYGLSDNHYYCNCGKSALADCRYKCDGHEPRAANPTLLKVRNSFDF